MLVLAGIARPRWGLPGTVLRRLYGVAMIATAAFSHRPWLDVPFDAFEDVLHSVTASAVGCGFTLGVLLVALYRRPGATAAWIFDGVVVVVAMVVSMMVVNSMVAAGLAQRLMFAVGYVWYGLEAVRSARIPMTAPPGRGSGVG